MTKHIWTTKRGSKVWFEGTNLHVQSNGTDQTVALEHSQLFGCGVQLLPEGTWIVQAVFSGGQGVNLGRYATPEYAGSLVAKLTEVEGSINREGKVT